MASDTEHNDTPIEKMAAHMAVLNDEMGEVQVDMAIVKTDVSWLKKVAWWQLGLLGTLLLGAVGYILFG